MNHRNAQSINQNVFYKQNNHNKSCFLFYLFNKGGQGITRGITFV